MHIKKNIFGLFIAFAILTGISVNIFADGEVIPAGKEFKPDSKASILMEASTGTVLSENNSSEPLPIGTLNKIMTVNLTFFSTTLLFYCSASSRTRCNPCSKACSIMYL